LDGYIVCLNDYDILWKDKVTPSTRTLDIEMFSKGSMQSFLKENKENYMLIAVQDEATFGLCEEVKEIFSSWGGEIKNLRFRGSYVGVFKDGKLVDERIENENVANLKLELPQIPNLISLSSGGNNLGSFSSIKFGSDELSGKLRGFNIAVINENGEVIKTVVFDTFRSCFAYEVLN
jgi:hypothetical protein